MLHSRSLQGSPTSSPRLPGRKEVLSLDSDPRGYRYALVKANLYITEQALLFAGLQYREDLMRVLLASDSRFGDLTEISADISGNWTNFRQIRTAKYAVLARMLRIIHHLPVDALCE